MAPLPMTIKKLHIFFAQIFETTSNNVNCLSTFLSHRNLFSITQVDFSLVEIPDNIHTYIIFYPLFPWVSRITYILLIFVKNLPIPPPGRLSFSIFSTISELTTTIIIPILNPKNKIRCILIPVNFSYLYNVQTLRKIKNRKHLWCLEKEQLLKPHQNAFTKLRSPADNIIIIIESEIRETFVIST